MTEKKLATLSNVSQRENGLIKSVYLWMTLGLALTALVSYLVASSPELLNLFFSNAFSMIILLVAQFGLVIFLSSRIQTMKTSSAIIAFIAYSIVTGITLSTIFLAYTATSIFNAFAVSSIMFLGMSLYASFTKRNLASWSTYLVMGLWGLIIASLVNIFLASSTLYFGISIIGVLIFLGLTAYDTQKVVQMNRTYSSSMTEEEYTKIGIMGALNLYLDFLNIFLYLLRIFGRSRD